MHIFKYWACTPADRSSRQAACMSRDAIDLPELFGPTNTLTLCLPIAAALWALCFQAEYPRTSRLPRAPPLPILSVPARPRLEQIQSRHHSGRRFVHAFWLARSACMGKSLSGNNRPARHRAIYELWVSEGVCTGKNARAPQPRFCRNFKGGNAHRCPGAFWNVFGRVLRAASSCGWEARLAALPAIRLASLPHFFAGFLPRRLWYSRPLRTPGLIRSRIACARGASHGLSPPTTRPAYSAGVRPIALRPLQKLYWIIIPRVRLLPAAQTSPDRRAHLARAHPSHSWLLCVMMGQFDA